MKKIAIGLGSVLIVFLLIAIIVPFFFKDKLIEAANNEISKNINAKVSIGDLDVSILKNIQNFPNIALTVNELSIVGKDDFQQDTLVNLESANVSLDIMSVINGSAMKINAITLENGSIHAIVLGDGKANWNITKPSTEKEEPSKFEMSLKKLDLKQIHIKYTDLQTNKYLEIQNLNHSGKGDFTENLVDYISETDIEKINFVSGGVPFLKNAHLAYSGDVNIDQAQKKYGFKENAIQLNALKIALDGSVQMLANDAIQSDVTFKTDNTQFKDVLSLIPAIYAKDFDKMEANGKFNLDGKINGLYQGDIYPKMDIKFNILNGNFQYPSLPKKVSNINITSNITSPGGSMDMMILDISKFGMQLGNDPFSGSLKVANMKSNPYVKLIAVGKMNLEDVKSFYPMEDVKTLSGLMNINLNLEARKSDIDAKRYEAIKASGTVDIKGLNYASTTVEKPVKVNTLDLIFSPQFVDMTSCVGQIGKTDFDMKGKLENFIAYYLSKEAVMKGNLTFLSHYVDANEFLPKEETKKSSTDYVYVPKNINFTGSMNIKSMDYGKMNIQNLIGGMKIENETVQIQNVNADLLGGKAILNGSYSTVNSSKPVSLLNYNIQSFDMKKVFENVESAKKLAPIMQFMTGSVSSKSSITTSLLPDMSPDLMTTSGDFSASIPLAKVVGLPALDKIAELTKLSQLKNLEVNNINANLSIDKGKILLQPVNFNANNMKMGLQGAQGLDKSLDYKMSIDVPFSQLGPANSVVDGLLGKVNLPFLGQIKPEKVRLNLNIKGFFDKPQISLGTPEMLKGDGSTATSPTNAAIDMAKQKGEELKNTAIKAADSAKKQIQKEVEKKVDETKKQVEQEVEKKKNELMDGLRKKLPW